MGHRVHWHDRCHSSQYLVSIFESPTFWLRVFRLSNIFKYFTEKTSFSDYNFKVSSKMCQCLKIWFGQILKPISDSRDHASPDCPFCGTFFFPAAYLCCVYPLVKNTLIPTKLYTLWLAVMYLHANFSTIWFFCYGELCQMIVGVISSLERVWSIKFLSNNTRTNPFGGQSKYS